MYGLQSIVLCSGSVTDDYGEWPAQKKKKRKKRAAEAVNSTTPTLSPQRAPLPASTPRTMIAAGVRQEASLENINTLMEALVCVCDHDCARMERNGGRRLRRRSGQACFPAGKACQQVNMQHNQSRGITHNYPRSHKKGWCDVHFIFKHQTTIRAAGPTCLVLTFHLVLLLDN